MRHVRNVGRAFGPMVVACVLVVFGLPGCDGGGEPPGAGGGGSDGDVPQDASELDGGLGADGGDVAGDGGRSDDGDLDEEEARRLEEELRAESQEDPSRNHYAARPSEDMDTPPVVEELDAEESDGPGRAFRTERPPRPPWNSPTGRRRLSGGTETPDIAYVLGSGWNDDGAEAGLAYSDGVCTTPRFGGEFCRVFPNDVPRDCSDPLAPGQIRARSLHDAFDSEASIQAYLGSVRPYLPFYLPFRDPQVRLAQGYHYNDGDAHHALDFFDSETDVTHAGTFVVRAAADGVVRQIFWQQGGGNIVLIEHTAANGFRFLTGYVHLRNGKAHDQAKVAAMDCVRDPIFNDADRQSRCRKYKRFLERHPNHPVWGSNLHRIYVTVGQRVRAGQIIGWAGSTGIGSLPRVLDENGDPTASRAIRVNTHLHFVMLAQSPHEEDTFIYVDPYGVYGQQDSGCYDLLADTEFSRLFAPFYPSFHNVPLQVFGRYRGYWKESGGQLRTLSLHRDGGMVRASGAFQWGGPATTGLTLYATQAQLQAQATAMQAAGHVPRETTVVARPGNGEPRFSVLWRAKEPGEQYAYLLANSPAQRQAHWDEYVVNREWRLADSFRFDGGARMVGLYTNHQARPFWAYFGQSSDAAAATIGERLSEDGALPTSLQIVESGGGARTVDTIFTKPGGCVIARWGMSPGAYQAFFDELVGERGYRLAKLRGYADSTRFAALFEVPPAQVSGACP